MDKQSIIQYTNTFNQIATYIEGDNHEQVEVWFARDLQPQLGYARWENFESAIHRASEKQLSRNIFERGVDDRGYARIRSKGDTALFGGHTTEDMKLRLGIKSTRPLADFLPTLTIAAKNLATEMTNYRSAS